MSVAFIAKILESRKWQRGRETPGLRWPELDRRETSSGLESLNILPTTFDHRPDGENERGRRGSRVLAIEKAGLEKGADKES